MIAVRYVSLRVLDGKSLFTYQGRVRLTSAVVTTASGPITAIRDVGYAEVEVPGKTHPDEIRRLLAEEFAAGRWWVFVPGGPGLPPTRLTVGVPQDTTETPVPARV